jgi:hypothetical protein
MPLPDQRRRPRSPRAMSCSPECGRRRQPDDDDRSLHDQHPVVSDVAADTSQKITATASIRSGLLCKMWMPPPAQRRRSRSASRLQDVDAATSSTSTAMVCGLLCKMWMLSPAQRQRRQPPRDPARLPDPSLSTATDSTS